MNVFEEELRRRVIRVAGGSTDPENINAIFLALRDHAQGHEAVLEIGDLIAHRGQRERGLSTQQTRDVFLSFRSWMKIRSGHGFTVDDIRRVAQANLRTVTEQQLQDRVGLSKQQAASSLEQGLRLIERGKAKKGSARQRSVIDYLGGAFIWNPAFTQAGLMDDLIEVLTAVRMIDGAQVDAFRHASDLLALHVLQLMHGSRLTLEDGRTADLVVGYDNDQRFLEAKALLAFDEFSRPVRMPFCVFWTSLSAEAHCADELLVDDASWQIPLEVRDRKLTELR